MASIAQCPETSESRRARPSSRTTWNRARRRASAGAHHRSSTGQGPAHPTISTGAPASMSRKAGSPVSSSRALTPTGARSPSSTTAGKVCERTRAGAGRGNRPGQGGIGTGRLTPRPLLPPASPPPVPLPVPFPVPPLARSASSFPPLTLTLSDLSSSIPPSPTACRPSWPRSRGSIPA